MNSRYELNKDLAQMLKDGVIMDVTTPGQTRIVEETGACAVMALERILADIHTADGVSRMNDPRMTRGIQQAVSIPAMARVRIRHFAEAQILQAIETGYIDESEVLSPADGLYHTDKTKFDVPPVYGAKNLGGAPCRAAGGASMIHAKGKPGTEGAVQAVRHMRLTNRQIHEIQSTREDKLFHTAKELQVPYKLVRSVFRTGRLPAVSSAAGGIATPADAALMMQFGAEDVFMDSGIFKSGSPAKRVRTITQAVTNYNDSIPLTEPSEDLREAMVGINEQEIELLTVERGIWESEFWRCRAASRSILPH